MSTKDRLITFIGTTGLSPSAFEKKTGLSNGYVNNIRKSIGEDALTKILVKYPTLNKSWLLLGDGEMEVGVKTINTTVEAQLQELNEKVVLLKATVKVFGMTISEIKSKIEKTSYASVALDLERTISGEVSKMLAELKTK